MTNGGHPTTKRPEPIKKPAEESKKSMSQAKQAPPKK